MSLSYQAALQEPLLDAKQERMAIIGWQQKGDKKSLEILVRSHVRLVWAQALNWSNNPVHLEDLVAEGIIGLMRAADTFDLSFRVRFSTYAKWWVTAGISAALSRVKIVIDIPSRIYVEACSNKRQGKTIDQAHSAIQGIISLDAPVADVRHHGQGGLQCSELNPEEQVVAKSSSKALSRMLYAALASLNPIEQKIIKRLKLKSEPDCTRDLAEELKMTQARLRQIERHAVMRLRNELPKCGFNLEMLN
jgi:RNA polymerase sigma-32 factor